MTQKEMDSLAYELNKLQAPKNEEQGVSCIKTMVLLLHCGNFDKASAVANNEWDKISFYNDIAKVIIDNGLYTPINFTAIFKQMGKEDY